MKLTGVWQRPGQLWEWGKSEFGEEGSKTTYVSVFPVHSSARSSAASGFMPVTGLKGPNNFWHIVCQKYLPSASGGAAFSRYISWGKDSITKHVERGTLGKCCLWRVEGWDESSHSPILCFSVCRSNLTSSRQWVKMSVKTSYPHYQESSRYSECKLLSVRSGHTRGILTGFNHIKNPL